MSPAFLAAVESAQFALWHLAGKCQTQIGQADGTPTPQHSIGQFTAGLPSEKNPVERQQADDSQAAQEREVANEVKKATARRHHLQLARQELRCHRLTFDGGGSFTQNFLDDLCRPFARPDSQVRAERLRRLACFHPQRGDNGETTNAQRSHSETTSKAH